MTISTMLLVIIIIFTSTLTRSSLGFGDGLIGMPLLTLVVGVSTATPLVGLIATTIAITILRRNWRQVDLRAAWRLIVASMVGIPLGLYLLTTVPETIVKVVLGLILILFSLYNLVRPTLPELHTERYAYVFGFVAGVLGGAYNINGPPAVIYGTLRRWPPTQFRATLQAYFFPTGFFILIGHALAGLWTVKVFTLYVLVFPVVMLAIWLGGRVNQHIPIAQFSRIIYGFLVVVGVVMLI